MSEENARELLRERKVELLWGGKRVRALRVVDERAMTEHFGRSDWSGHTSSRHYSHDHETPFNPRGVWTLTHLGKAA